MMASTTWPWTFADNVMRTVTVQKRKLSSTSRSSRLLYARDSRLAYRSPQRLVEKRQGSAAQPDKRIDPIKIRAVRRTIAKFGADLTLEQHDNYKIEIDFGIEAIAMKAHLAFPRYLIEGHDDEDGARHFKKT
jgi:hypothetical protein